MLFGTNGVRGLFDELDPLLALKIAKGIGLYFKSGKIGVARDARLTGECLEHAIVSGLMSTGCKVINFGIISSPTAEFMIKKLKLDGLIIITASHNPPEWNAIKVVDGKGVAISRERGEEIEKLMDSTKKVEWNKIGKEGKYSKAIEDHIEAIVKEINIPKIKKRKPKLVLDPGNGAAGTIVSELFRRIGCEVIEINSKLDGNFPNRNSEPTKENVKGLIEQVKKEKADAGIAWDGDGDRVIFVDGTGEYIIGDKVFGISTNIRLKEKLGEIVTTVATSRMIEDIGKKFGVKTTYTKVGAPYLSEEMAKGRAVIGGEEVGGVIWPEFSLAKEGMLTAAKMVEALCEKKLSEMVGELPKYYLKKIKIEVKDEAEKKKALEKVKKYAEKEKLEHITIDGVRINYPNQSDRKSVTSCQERRIVPEHDRERVPFSTPQIAKQQFVDGWVIIRASGTEPVIRIFAEGKTEKEAEELLEKIKKIATN